MISDKYFLCAALVLMSCSGIAFACHGKLLASGITKEEKQIILQEHNKLRQMVATGRYPGQPAAENMREIVWDDELASRAQKWADNCQFRHDPLRTINRFTMGQNVALIWSTAPLDPDDGDFPSRIKNWFNEVHKYSFGDAWSTKTGHYSQLVWGETSLVGCGYSEYKDTTKYNKLYVCNYGPGGNVVGYNPYEIGKPSCATYGLRSSSRYPGLCAASSTAANTVTSNTIENYDYKATNAFSNKVSAYGTQLSQQASSLYTRQVPEAAPARGGSTAHLTEPDRRNNYRNKLEAYKPSAAEFQSSVRKHTVLRSYLTQSQTNSAHTQEQQHQQQEQQQRLEAVGTTKKGPIRGWSLLTWRG